MSQFALHSCCGRKASTDLIRLLRQQSKASAAINNKAYSQSASNSKHSDVKKLVKVSVIGDPNAGKSTLINTFLGCQVNSVSNKAHTTRRNSRSVLNSGSTQLVFVDTPGFVKEHYKHVLKSEKHMIEDPYAAVENIDVVVVLKDATDYYGYRQLSAEVSKAMTLMSGTTRAILTFNKVDLVRDKRDLLEYTRLLTNPSSGSETIRQNRNRNLDKLFELYETRLMGESMTTLRKPAKFDEVFMVSALTGIGVDKLKSYLLSKAVESEWMYEGGFLTDQSITDTIISTIRGQILDRLSEEIPYTVGPVVDFVDEDDDGVLHILVTLPCVKRRTASSLMGKGGSTIRSIAQGSEKILADALQKPVVLKVRIKTY